MAIEQLRNGEGVPYGVQAIESIAINSTEMNPIEISSIEISSIGARRSNPPRMQHPGV